MIPSASQPPVEKSDTVTQVEEVETEVVDSQSEDENDASDTDDGTIDSALGGLSLASSTTVPNSEIFRSIPENGRTYHAHSAGSYPMPNDERERERLELQHYMFLNYFKQQLALAPIPSKVHRVLDVGCGTADWTYAFAEEHLEAHVTGVDLSPIQPDSMPPNVEIEIDDLEKPWNFSKSFDYIHCRMMNGSFEDYPRFFRQCYKFTSPGGYLEMVDCAFPIRSDDDTIPKNGSIASWIKLLRQASAQLHRPFDSVPDFRNMMLDAGYHDVVERQFKWPINSWPDKKSDRVMGSVCLGNLMEALGAATYAAFSRGLGWTLPQIETFLIGVRQEFSNTDIHAYWPIYVVYGRKPKASSDHASEH